MPTEELIVMGASIVNNPEGYAVDAEGDVNDGAYLTGGESVFEDDDVVVFLVDNVNADGTLSDSSVITGIVVYDSAADYLNGEAMYTYTLENGSRAGHGKGSDRNWTGGQSGDVSTSVQSMGDAYLHFRASHFTSDDAGAPDLDDLFLAPGVDLSEEIPLWIGHEEDIDYNQDGTITDSEVGDGIFSTDNNIFATGEIGTTVTTTSPTTTGTIDTTVCLTRGTLIDTPEGPRYIETLQIGDLVHTLDHGPQPIRWIGSQRVAATGDLAPIRITAGALGNLRDLMVSPNHRMLMRGPLAEVLFGERDVLVAAKHLLNDDTIRQIEGGTSADGTVEYFHMLFETHQIIFAEACPTESLYPGQEALNSVGPEARHEILTLFPEFEGESGQSHLSRYELKAWEAEALKARGVTPALRKAG